MVNQDFDMLFVDSYELGIMPREAFKAAAEIHTSTPQHCIQVS